jgi:hypothetical protein
MKKTGELLDIGISCFIWLKLNGEQDEGYELDKVSGQIIEMTANARKKIINYSFW